MVKQLTNGGLFTQRLSICCKLFSTSTVLLGSGGFSDWSNMAKYLSQHETSSHHIRSLHCWLELENRLGTEETIDKHTQKMLNAEKQH